MPEQQWYIWGWKIEGRDEAKKGEGRRNAHPAVPWFARRQGLYSAFQWRHNKHSIGELTSHVEPWPVWLKSKKEGLYLLMIGWRTQHFCWPLVEPVPVMQGENASVWPSIWVRRCQGFIQAEVSEPSKIQDHTRHADTEGTNTHLWTLWTLLVLCSRGNTPLKGRDVQQNQAQGLCPSASIGLSPSTSW